jgi:hypothetical protein
MCGPPTPKRGEREQPDRCEEHGAYGVRPHELQIEAFGEAVDTHFSLCVEPATLVMAMKATQRPTIAQTVRRDMSRQGNHNNKTHVKHIAPAKRTMMGSRDK